MTYIKILQKAIEHAEKNGFNIISFYDNKGINIKLFLEMELIDIYDYILLERHENLIIFNHDFAKAFFGNEWEYHLQQMVLCENPILYLEKFLKDK